MYKVQQERLAAGRTREDVSNDEDLLAISKSITILRNVYFQLEAEQQTHKAQTHVMLLRKLTVQRTIVRAGWPLGS